MLNDPDFLNYFSAIPESGLLGDVRGPGEGPTVLVVAALHGNEPAGLRAACMVLARLAAEGHLRRGRVVGVLGNRTALQAGVRYRARDLNRQWTDARVAALHQQPPEQDDAEEADQRRILAVLEPILAAVPTVLLDLHTTSAGGPPFGLSVPCPATQRLAQELPFPLVLGLLESVPGTITAWTARRGHVGLAVEGGQHADPGAEALHRAAIWTTLHALGAVDALPKDVEAELGRLPKPAAAVVECIAHHHIEAGDEFVMVPGYISFQPVQRGELLAHDRRGEVRCPETGRILMPLYQLHGQEGFFIVRDLDA